MKLQAKYDHRALKIQSLVCVGLDTDFDQLPERFQKLEHPQYEFNKWIVDQTHSVTAAYKPNLAFYEARGEAGWKELRLTMEYLREYHPTIFTIADAKRADIGSTNRGYVKAIFDELGFDSITLHPYLGREALQPFLEREDKVSIILCRTSNPGSGELQSLKSEEKCVWEIVAEKVKNDWNENENCMLVVGATYPEELAKVREIVGQMTLLVPGVGAQGGDAATVVNAGRNSAGLGLMINSSRGVTFNENPQRAAESLRDEINTALKLS